MMKLFLTTSSIGRVIALLVCMYWVVTPSLAQSKWVNDPMRMPDLWEQLVGNPVDSALWVEYYGKNWAEMTLDDREKITTWKQQLMLNALATNEAVVGFVIKPEYMNSDFFIDDIAFAEIMSKLKNPAKKTPQGRPITVTKAELAGIEAVILSENSTIAELKRNIRANFAVIEDHYAQIFKEFGINYEYYATKHPKGGYSEVKWVEEKDAELRKKKEEQIKQIRSKYK